ncbi:hypothetical protein MUK42_05556 [Musa troglodytarum]|uniref:Uncharacterized protein n=1 Tax=Musa troglodytarum TaxID=320322 RepID=A0A9E7EUQ7_9LILI|nr:hypothetical protein MUK42_05556 [Musa troglodytarum]
MPRGHPQICRLQRRPQIDQRRDRQSAEEALLQPGGRPCRRRGRPLPLHRPQGQRPRRQPQHTHQPQPPGELLWQERPRGLPVPLKLLLVAFPGVHVNSNLHRCSFFVSLFQ